jgi:hypothetical protein
MARKVRDYRAFLDPPREDIYTFISLNGNPGLTEEREYRTEQGYFVICYLKRDGVPVLRSRHCCFFDTAHEKYLAPYKKLIAQTEARVLHERFRYGPSGFNFDEREDLWDIACDNISINLYKNGKVAPDGSKLIAGNMEIYQYESEVICPSQREQERGFEKWLYRGLYPPFIGFAMTNYVWRSIWKRQLPGLHGFHGEYRSKRDAIAAAFAYAHNSGGQISRGIDLESYFDTHNALTLRVPEEATDTGNEDPLQYVFGVLPIFHIAHVLAWAKVSADSVWHQRELSKGWKPSATTDDPNFPLFYALLQQQQQ